MNPPNAKPRVSILKKRLSTVDIENEASVTVTGKLPRKGILFSEKNTVKEFQQCDEKTTIWGNSYETSIARSDGSSDDGSQMSKKFSLDFTSSSMISSSSTTSVHETDKENICIPNLPENSSNEEQRTGSMSGSEIELDNITVDLNIDEQKRLKKYGTNNLDITNLHDVNQALKEERMVLSPRKILTYNKESNYTVSVQEKVLVKTSIGSADNTILGLSIRLDDDSAEHRSEKRRTNLNPSEMNLTLDRASLKSPIPQRLFKMPTHRLANESDMQLDSPPIKAPKNTNDDSDMLLDFFVSETPTKNLCHQMCSSRKHGITPIQNPPSKVVYSSTKLTWGKKIEEFPRPVSPEFDLTIPETQPTINVSIDVDNLRESKRESLNYSHPMEESLVEPKEDEALPKLIEATDYAGENEVNETILKTMPVLHDSMEDLSQKPEMTVFDLDMQETTAGGASTLVKLKDLPASKSSSKRLTVHDADISLTCHYDDLARKQVPSMNSTTVSEGGIMETTNELAGKVARLLKNPMATASTSNLFTKSYQQENIPDISASQEPILSNSKNMSLCEDKQYSDKSSFNKVTLADIDISGILPSADSSKISEISSIEHAPLQSRKTINSSCSMETSRMSQEVSGGIVDNNIEPCDLPTEEKPIDSALKTATNSRGTIYAPLSIDESIEEKPSQEQIKTKSRVTVYEDSMIVEDSKLQNRDLGAVRKRGTVFEQSINFDESYAQNDGANLYEALKQSIISSIPRPQNEQKSVYVEEAMDMEESNEINQIPSTETASNNIPSPNRYQDSFKIENASPVSSRDDFKKPISTRMTVFDASMKLDKDEMILDNLHFNPCGRSTIYEAADCSNESNTNISEARNVVVHSFKFPEMNSFKIQMDMTAPKANQSEIMISEASSSRIISPPPAFQGSFDINQEMPSDHEIAPSPSNIPFEFKEPRNTIYVEENMEVSPRLDTRRTFAIDRSENRRLMEITTTEIADSLIDDESIPSMGESNASDKAHQRLSGLSALSLPESGNTTYQEAIQQFVNDTMNMTLVEAEEVKLDFELPIEPPSDICAELDDLLFKIQVEPEKDLPKFELDEYLEKLNIKPIKFKKHAMLEPGYFEKSAAERQARIQRKADERKAIRDNQYLPEIPSYSFLIDNLLQIADERIAAQEQTYQIVPIFPEDRSFESLLRNKFETDEKLSKFWKYDNTFAYMNYLKFTHQQMDPFKINFTVSDPVEGTSLDDSTIPIQFSGALMYTNPNYRGKINKRIKLLMDEFKRAMGTDNFLHMCSSMNELFDFLDFYHNEVIKCVSKVTTYFNIISRHEAITEFNKEQKMWYIVKRVFTQDDIIDLKIAHFDTIDNINIHCVYVEGVYKSYEIQPSPTLSLLKGLMVIETILFESEKFLQANTRSQSKD